MDEVRRIIESFSNFHLTNISLTSLFQKQQEK